MCLHHKCMNKEQIGKDTVYIGLNTCQKHGLIQRMLLVEGQGTKIIGEELVDVVQGIGHLSDLKKLRCFRIHVPKALML